jgi:hypothetical protein
MYGTLIKKKPRLLEVAGNSWQVKLAGSCGSSMLYMQRVLFDGHRDFSIVKSITL